MGNLFFGSGMALNPGDSYHREQIERAKDLTRPHTDAKLEAPTSFGDRKLATANFPGVDINNDGKSEDLFIAWQIQEDGKHSLIASVEQGGKSIFERRFDGIETNILPSTARLVDINEDGLKDVVLFMEKDGVEAGMMVFYGGFSPDVTTESTPMDYRTYYEVMPGINIDVIKYGDNSQTVRIVSGRRDGLDRVILEFNDLDGNGRVDYIRQYDYEPGFNEFEGRDHRKLVDFYRGPGMPDRLYRSEPRYSKSVEITAAQMGVIDMNDFARPVRPLADGVIASLFQLGDRLLQNSPPPPNFQSVLGRDLQAALGRRVAEYPKE